MIRLLIALVLSAGITLALFYLMQSLIASGNTALTDPPKGTVLDYVRVPKEETVQQKENKPRKPPPPKEPPPPMEQPQLDSASPNSEGSSMNFGEAVAADVALDGGLALDSGDGEYLPIVKVAPVYPRRALQRGIEGYVIVEFTVTKQGSVRDPVVVEAQPQGIFERAALDAALKFKYKPRVINGEATDVSGIQNRISFEIDG
jgi:protein TonB